MLNTISLLKLRILGCLILLCTLTGLAHSQEIRQHRLEPGDQVKITVFGHADLSGQFEVDSTGRLSLPLIRDVAAGGLTLQELEAAITDKLQPDYLKNPKINIEVMNYRPFYIIGEVNKPGSYPYVNGLTVMRAIALAGGYTYRAKKNKARISRANDPEQSKVPASYDTPILPGDTIEIPERFF